VTEFEDKKRRKIQEMQDEMKDKEVEGCTFHPDISISQNFQSGDKNKRTMDQFLEDQRRFQEKVHKKTEELKAKSSVENESIQHLSLAEGSLKILESR
jgi:hypothetical protein